MNDLLYNVNKAVKKTVFINGNFDFTKIKNIKQIIKGIIHEIKLFLHRF